MLHSVAADYPCPALLRTDPILTKVDPFLRFFLESFHDYMCFSFLIVEVVAFPKVLKVFSSGA
jgi:hypothetical protein